MPQFCMGGGMHMMNHFASAEQQQWTQGAAQVPSLPPAKRPRVQPKRFDEDLYDQTCAIIDNMSQREKEKLREYLGDGVTPREPTTRQQQHEPEVCLREIFSHCVDVQRMDADDVTTVAETLCELLTKILPNTLACSLVADMLEHVLKDVGNRSASLLQKVLQIPCVQDEFLKPPPALQPDAIANLPDHHPDKVKKWRELNKEMVRRVVRLQTAETQKFWLREGVKPVAASSNERDVFFDIVRVVRLQCTKPEIKEFLTWFKMNVPSKFKKHAAGNEGSLRARQVAPHENSRSSPTTSTTLCVAPAVATDATTAPSQDVASTRRFDISTYTLDKFAKDAATLQYNNPTLVSVKDVGKSVKFDSNPELNQSIAEFDHALETFGLTKPVRDDVYQHLKSATLSLGLRCNKSQVEDLRRWIARALALKHQVE